MSDDLVKRLRSPNGPFNWEDAVATYLEAADSIQKLEAALRSVLQYRLTDETWVKLGFDPKKIRLEFDAARKTLEGKDD